MTAGAVRAVLWDADGVLQHTPAHAWDRAVRVVTEFPGALTGTPIDETRIRAVAHEVGLGEHVDDIVAVWSRFDVLGPTLEVVGLVRAGGTPCYLATNQDAFRADRMRERAPYGEVLDGAYYSCDLGVAKPSTAFFEHIVTDLDLTPGELLFVDDRPANVAAARSCGLRAERWIHGDGVAQLHDLLAVHGLPVDAGREHP